MSKITKVLARFDAWTNHLTGWGGERDKTEGSRPGEALRLDHNSLLEWWLGDKMAAKIIEGLPAAELANGWDFQAPGDPDASMKMSDELKRLGFARAYLEARRWARLYGGAAIVMGVDDGRDASLPLDEAAIRGVRWLKVVDRHQLTVATYSSDPREPEYGEPEIYLLALENGGALATGSRLVHRSRLIRFYGVPVPPRIRARYDGWGESVLPRLWRALRNYHQGHDAAGLILSDFATSVYTVPGLKDMLLKSPNSGPNCGENLLSRRFSAIERLRGLYRAVVLDEKETFERKSAPVTGLSDLIDKAEARLVAESEMPHTLLLGEGPKGGLGADGDGERRQWHGLVKEEQTATLVPALERVMSLVMLSREAWTRGVEPEAWTVEPNPLDQATAEEEADTRLKVAQADAIYLDRGVLAASDVAASRFGGEHGYSPDTQIDPADIEAMREAEEQAMEQAEALAPAAIDNPTPPPVNGQRPPPEDEDPED